MDSEEGIEKLTPVDAQTVGLLDPSLPRTDLDDTVMSPKDTLVAPSCNWGCSQDRSPTAPEGIRKWESYCLYVRVLKDAEIILEQDHKVPGHSWNDCQNKDICEAWAGVDQGTFSVNLLSDTEFLVYTVPKTWCGMTWEQIVKFVDLIWGTYPWGGILSNMYVGQWTLAQGKRDKAKTHEYWCQITVEQLAATQAWLQELDLVIQKHKQQREDPRSCGWGMTHRADKYYAQQHGHEQELAPSPVPELPVFPPKPGSPMSTIHHIGHQNLNTTMISLMIQKMAGMMFPSTQTLPIDEMVMTHYAHYMAQLDLKDYDTTMPTNTGKNPTDLEEIVSLKKKFTMLVFESAILHCCTHKMMMMAAVGSQLYSIILWASWYIWPLEDR